MNSPSTRRSRALEELAYPGRAIGTGVLGDLPHGPLQRETATPLASLDFVATAERQARDEIVDAPRKPLVAQCLMSRSQVRKSDWPPRKEIGGKATRAGAARLARQRADTVLCSAASRCGKV